MSDVTTNLNGSDHLETIEVPAAGGQATLPDIVWELPLKDIVSAMEDRSTGDDPIISVEFANPVDETELAGAVVVLRGDHAREVLTAMMAAANAIAEREKADGATEPPPVGRISPDGRDWSESRTKYTPAPKEEPEEG